MVKKGDIANAMIIYALATLVGFALAGYVLTRTTHR